MDNKKNSMIHIIEKYFPIVTLILFATAYFSFSIAQNMLVTVILFAITFLFVLPLALLGDKIDDDKALFMPKIEHQDEQHTHQSHM